MVRIVPSVPGPKASVTEKPVADPDEGGFSNVAPKGYFASDPEAIRRGVKLFKPKGRTDLIVTSAIITVVLLLQARGNLVFDTKLAMVTDPARFMSQSIHLWDPLGSFGQIQNQAYGYLFPMGPFYALMSALHVPAWVTQRLWASGVIVVGVWGAVFLAEELRIGNRPSRLIAGVAYGASSFVVSLGPVTTGGLPNAFLPWALLAIVVATRRRVSPIRWVALSSLAVACMGGINAASVLMVLPAPLIWILTREKGPRKRRLLSWWFAGSAAAAAWWLGPLVLQGKYGFNFLPFTESAKDTNAATSATETMRGAGFWLSYLDIKSPWEIGGWIVSTNSVIIIGTIIVSAAGLFGLAKKNMPERAFFFMCIALGIAITGMGYVGPFSDPAHGLVQTLLNGAFAPFRNVSKIEPLITLGMAMGIAHAIVEIRIPNFNWAYAEIVPWVVVLVAVVASAGPLVVGKFYSNGSFKQVPNYWYQATDWVGSHAGRTTTLYVPGSTFGEYTWGRPIDEPLWFISSSPWALHSIIPLGSNGSTLLLDQIDKVLDGGEPVPGFADYLSRAGISYVVARNDLQSSEANTPSPKTVQGVLAAEPGLKLVKTFGPHLKPGKVSGVDLGYQTLQSSLNEIDLYKVEPYGEPVSVVAMYPTKGGIVTSGDPGSLMQVAGSGMLVGRLDTLAGDPYGYKGPGSTWVVTDSNRNVDTNFGKLHNNESYVLPPGQESPNSHAPPKTMTVVPGIQHMTVAKLEGVKSITASSYGSPIDYLPGFSPVFPFSGDPNHEWAAATPQAGSWIQVNFDSPLSFNSITFAPQDGQNWRPAITQITISTQGGSRDYRVPTNGGTDTYQVAPGTTGWMRITIDRMNKAKVNLGSGPAIKRIGIPGITVSSALQVPSDEVEQYSGASANLPSYLFSSPVPNPVDPYSAPDGEPQMNRIFTVPKSGYFGVSGLAQPKASEGLNTILGGNGDLKVSTSSTFQNLPWFRPSELIQPTPDSGWLEDLNDKNPTVTMKWSEPRTLNILSVQSLPFLKDPVTNIKIQSADGTREVNVPRGSGIATFSPLTTNSVTITFPGAGGQKKPVGFLSLSFPQLADLVAAQIPPSTPFRLACGTGPPVVVDSLQYPTQISGTWGDLESLRPLTVSVCGQPIFGVPVPSNEAASVFLNAGQHMLSVDDTGYSMKVTQLGLNGGTFATPPPKARSLKVVKWSSENREVSVGAGPQQVLAVNQNFNLGWVATMGGTTLKAVRIDGWRQGWVVPAGSGGAISMTYPPDQEFVLFLLLGLLLLVLLAVFAVLPTKRGEDDEPLTPVGLSSSIWSMLLVVVPVFLVGGIGVLTVPIMFYLRYKRIALSRVAFACLFIAGVLDAAKPGRNPFSGAGPWIGLGPFAGPAQLFAVSALAAVAVSMVSLADVQDLARRMVTRIRKGKIPPSMDRRANGKMMV